MKKPNRAPAGQIRIIGGQWRGRKLPVPDSPGLRPTTDRVRETLFNWLAPLWWMPIASTASPVAAH
jgi:16S rRNA (guanine966-N2)-methyltransferase